MLEEHIKKIELSRDSLAQRWSETEKVQNILPDELIKTGVFQNQYAVGVIDYFIGVLKKEKQLGNCPIMHTMLQEFQSANLSSEDVFLICAQFKRTLINFAFQENFATQVNIDQINFMLDENFSGVIRLYDEILKSQVKKIKVQENTFTEYNNALNTATIISKTDINGVITHVNKAFEDISGYSSEELLGKKHNIVRHSDMSASFFKEMWQTLKNQETFHATIQNKRKDRSSYYVKTHIFPIVNIHGETIEFLSIREDVTELMNLIKKEKELNKLKDEILSKLSHEINTPLNAIIGGASLIKRKIKDPKFDQYISIMDEGSQRAKNILSTIKELTTYMNDEVYATYSLVDLYTICNNYFSSKRTALLKENVAFDYSISEHLSREVLCDFNLIQKILDELIDNSTKFNQNEVVIAVKVIENLDAIIIEVTDNGIGIEKEKLDSVFELFYQVDSSDTRVYEGLGVGLTKVKRIVDILGGTIQVESEKDKGSTFTIELHKNL